MLGEKIWHLCEQGSDIFFHGNDVNIAKAAVYLGPTADSLEMEVKASIMCTTAVLSYVLFDKWEIDLTFDNFINDNAFADDVEIITNIGKMNDALSRVRKY